MMNHNFLVSIINPQNLWVTRTSLHSLTLLFDVWLVQLKLSRRGSAPNLIYCSTYFFRSPWMQNHSHIGMLRRKGSTIWFNSISAKKVGSAAPLFIRKFTSKLILAVRDVNLNLSQFIQRSKTISFAKPSYASLLVLTLGIRLIIFVNIIKLATTPISVPMSL